MTLKVSKWILFASALGLSASWIALCPLAAGQQSLPCAAPKPSQQRTVLSIDRSSRSGVILTTVQVNGKPAVLILDTGSNVTILSPEISGFNPGRLPRAAPPQKGTGFERDGRWGQATLTVGTRVWKDRRVLVADTKKLSRAFQQKIDGILGQDILDEFKYVEIDLEKKCLVLGSE